MKNKYFSTLIILLLSMCFEFRQGIKLAKAEEFNKSSQKEYFLVNHNPKNYFNEKNQDLIKKSFYANGYTFEESLKLKIKSLTFFEFHLKLKTQYLVFLSKELNLMHLVFGILIKMSGGIKYQKMQNSLMI